MPEFEEAYSELVRISDYYSNIRIKEHADTIVSQRALLLEACKLAIQNAAGWADDLSSFNSGQPKGSEAERTIRAAIAKAEGA